MSIGQYLRGWRIKRRLTISEVEDGAGLSQGTMESIEEGRLDPTASVLASIAPVMGIPASWLFADPEQVEEFNRVLEDAHDGDRANLQSIDPVVEQILKARSNAQNLFYLLSLLIQSGEEKQIRAAEINLRSLIKQTRRSPIPWENRQPGNFDPPSD